MLANVGVLDDQGALEITQHARGDIPGERNGSLGFRDTILLLSFLRIPVRLGGRLSGRLRRGEDVVEMIVVEVGVYRPFALLQGMDEL